MKDNEARTSKPVIYSALAFALALVSFLAGRAVRPRDVAACDPPGAGVAEGPEGAWEADVPPVAARPARLDRRRALEPLRPLPVIPSAPLPSPPPVADMAPDGFAPEPLVRAPAVDVTAKGVSDPAEHARMLVERTREVEARVESSGVADGAPADWQVAASTLRDSLRRSVGDTGVGISALRCFRDGCIFSLVGSDRAVLGRTSYRMAELLAQSALRLPGGTFLGGQVTGADGQTGQTVVLYRPGEGAAPAMSPL